MQPDPSMSTDAELLFIVFVIVVLLLVVLLIRELICWYFKINKRLGLLKSIDDHLEEIKEILSRQRGT